MKKLIIGISLFVLAGCRPTVLPLPPKFPDAPSTLQQRCSALKEATNDMPLSQFTKVVVQNYILYHECALKVEGWNEWYAEQKKIFEEPTKK